MTKAFEFGLDTFGDVTRGADGALLPHAQVIRNVIEEAVLADKLELFGFKDAPSRTSIEPNSQGYYRQHYM